jgi:hypothetical protein
VTGLRGWMEVHSRKGTVVVVGGAILLIAIAALLVVNLISSALGTAGPGTSSPPSAQPSPSASAPGSASADPSESPSPTAVPPSVTYAGPFAATVLVNDLNVREEPATGTVTDSLASGTVVMIYEGPRPIDGSDWYFVQRGFGVGGWVSAGPADDPYLQFHERVASRMPASVAGVAGGDAGYVAWGTAAQESSSNPSTFVATSTDGTEWSVGALPEAITDALNAKVAHGPSGWLMAAGTPEGTALAGLWRSSDGLTWATVDRTTGIDGPPSQLIGFDAGFVMGVIGTDSSGSTVERLVFSSDGEAWQEVDVPLDPQFGFLNVLSLGDGVVAWNQGSDDPPLVYYSADGIAWTDASSGGSRAMITDQAIRMARLGNGLVAVSHVLDGGTLRVWSATPLASGFDWVRNASAESQLAGTAIDSLVGLPDGALIIGRSFEDGRLQMWRSADAATWQELDAATESEGGIGAVALGGAGLVGIGYDITPAGPNPYFMRSTDGEAWQGEAEPVLGVVESPVMGGCPAQPTTMVDWLAVPGSIGAECFGGASISFRGWLTVGGGCGGFHPGRFEPEWLANPFAAGAVILDPNEVEFGGCGSATPHPDLSELPDPQQWVQVTGHWADPASPQCRVIPLPGQAIGGSSDYRGPDLITFECRMKFVATEVSPTTAP